MKNLKMFTILYWTEIVLAVLIPISFFLLFFLNPNPNFPSPFDSLAFMSELVVVFGTPFLFGISIISICLTGILRFVFYRVKKVVENETITKKLLLTSLLVFLEVLVAFGIVWASLSTPRPKSRDSAIKANMNNSRVSFELYYDSHGQSYLGGCEDKTIKEIYQIAGEKSGQPVICRDSEKEWVVETALVDREKGKFLCFDSLGNMPTLDHQLAEGQMKCK
jgi:hypothetical protein